MDAEATAQRLYEALSTGNADLVDDVLAPDWEDIPMPPGAGLGPDTFKGGIAYLRSVFPDLDVTVEDVVVDGDRVAVRSVVRGTHSAEILGVAATGRRVEFGAFDFHRLEDGRIVQSWHLEDYYGLLNQLRAPAADSTE